MKFDRLLLGLVILTAVLATAGVVAAAPPANHPAGGDHPRKAGRRFESADKNKDGFLTKDEVGERRWARIVVADANHDGKVSKAELAKAHADGKLGRHKRDNGNR